MDLKLNLMVILPQNVKKVYFKDHHYYKYN